MGSDYRIGVVTSYGDGWHARELLCAAAKVGRVGVLSPISVSVRIGEVAEVRFGLERASEYDALLLRGLNEEGLPDFQLEALRLLEDAVPVVINRIDPILTALDKCRTSYLLRRAGLPTPPTMVTQRQGEAEEAVEEFGEAVLKPLYGSLGEGITRVRPGREGSDSIARMLKRFHVVYIQRFMPPGGRDIRAFVVGGRVVAAIQRVARRGEWITNVHRGASAHPIVLPAALAALCAKAADVVGLDYTGVDIIESDDGPVVIEVNGTPSWMGVDAAWRRSMATEIVDLAVRRLAYAERSGPGLRATA